MNYQQHSNSRYTVFPLHPIRPDGTCGCNEEACARPGKHPAIKWGDLKQGVVEKGPAGHGIVTGAKSTIFVVDTDTPEADARFREWVGEAALETYTVKTPKGGRHYYYAHPGFPVRCSVGELLVRADDPKGRSGKPNSKIDIRGDGGFVVAAGSPHRNGKRYEEEKKVAPRHAPAQLLEWPGLRGHARSIVGPAAAPTYTRSREDRVAAAQKWLEPMPASQSGNGADEVACAAVFGATRTCGLTDEEMIREAIASWNSRCVDANGAPWPWRGRELDHLVYRALHECELQWHDPVAHEHFVESMRRAGPEGDDNRRKEYREAAAKKIGKRVRNPNHRYVVEVGDPRGSKNKPETIEAHEAIETLFGGHADWDGVLCYDEIRDTVLAINPPIALDAEKEGRGLTDDDVTRIRTWFVMGTPTLNEKGEPIFKGPKKLKHEEAYRAARATAKRRSFNPIREYLEGCYPIEGSIERLGREAMGLSDPVDLAYLRRFLIAAVRRAMQPGTKVDTVFTLRGDTALRKSTFVTSLFGREWSTDSVGSIEKEKEVGENVAGKWCVELAELKALRSASPETILAFLTRTTDRFRGSYARGNAVDRPRSCVFVATTNDLEILRNTGGAEHRRFWIVEIARPIDIGWIEAHRDGVWGEAFALAATGEPHWLNADEERAHFERMRKYEDPDPWHPAITAYIKGKDLVRTEDVWAHLGGNLEKFNKSASNRIASTLRRLGCESGLVGPSRARVRMWRVPERSAQEDATGAREQVNSSELK